MATTPTYKICRGILTSSASTDLVLVGNERPRAFSLDDESSMDQDIFRFDDGTNAVREALLMMRVAAEIARIAKNYDRLKGINDKISEYEFVLGGPMSEGNTSEGRPRPMMNAGDDL